MRKGWVSFSVPIGPPPVCPVVTQPLNPVRPKWLRPHQVLNLSAPLSDRLHTRCSHHMVFITWVCVYPGPFTYAVICLCVCVCSYLVCEQWEAPMYPPPTPTPHSNQNILLDSWAGMKGHRVSCVYRTCGRSRNSEIFLLNFYLFFWFIYLFFS